MMQSAFTNAANNVPVNALARTDKQADIVKRLEELNRWQEEQKKLLEIRQIKQREMLGMEQKTMYQQLGLQSESEMTLVGDAQKDDNVENLRRDESVEQLEEYVDESVVGEIDSVQLCGNTDDQVNKDKKHSLDGISNSEHQSATVKKSRLLRQKKPFLRSGEGLKQRFKIDPNDLRLSNLPRYKFANAHPNLNLKPLKKINQDKSNSSKPANHSTANKKTLENIPILDAQEQNFQNLLITSKNTYSSTPETKSSLANKNLLAKSKTEKIDPVLQIKSHESQAKKENTQEALSKVIAWSKILDPSEIKPLLVPRESRQSLPETEESIFELLEQKANDGSFDMESSCLKEFMARRLSEKLNESDDIPVQEHLKDKRLEPLVLDEKLQEPSFSSADEVEDEESQLMDEADRSTESDDNTHKTIETASSSYPHQPSQIRVRFSDSNETHEYDDEPETNQNDVSRLSAGSTDHEAQGDHSKNELFAQFREALFATLKIKSDQHLANNDSTLKSVDDTTITPKGLSNTSSNSDIDNAIYSPACKELQEKTDMIKLRLTELEKEIQVFKENNVILLKAKQEHELQKSLNAQEHHEAMESLKDEKIRMEIYLHDERVKLEDAKRQFEQSAKMKTQGLIAKERKECDRLKQLITQLELNLKSKESSHTAAQARLRTQIRNLEREQSKLHQQIENLTRETKRLENENLKISREQNNKILQEINRNIAKLTPKQIQYSSTGMPGERPPTLLAQKTVSKCIVAAAKSNKISSKANKSTNTAVYNSKRVPNSPPSPSHTTADKDAVTITETLATDGEKFNHNQHQKYMINYEEDEDNILEEFEKSAELDNNKNKLTANVSKKSPKSQLQETQHQVPLPPPSSPRKSGKRTSGEMKREIINDDGSKDIWYPNGNLKKISADGMIIRMLYYNKDIKETNINEGTVKYYYAEANTWHTTYLDGLEILEFPNGQVEHRHKNGVVEVHYPDNSVKIIDPNDENNQEEWRCPDGTHLIQMRNGDKILSLPNGQKEIHNKLHKRREYPDGTVKIVYPDGSTETRYSNGRVRLKDKDGILVMDTNVAK